jgi:hypothetical protein
MKELDTSPQARRASPGSRGAPGGVTTLGWSQFVVVAVVFFAILLLVGFVLWLR